MINCILNEINNIEMSNYLYKENLCASLYQHKQKKPKAVILYFHGGGLLFGNRNDLPQSHIKKFCENNYAIISFDYRLAPEFKIPDILSDLISGINWYLDNRQDIFNSHLPYCLWGRSAGAYLCLLAGKEKYVENPFGILSYYGYGLLENFWTTEPNAYYNRLPKLDHNSVSNLLCEKDKPADTRYSLYVYARQSGNWLSLIYDEPIKYLLLKYSLRVLSNPNEYPPLFLAHSFYDPDVPVDESKSLNTLIPNSELFLVSSDMHDFDRMEESSSTNELLERSVNFLDRLLD